MALRDCGGESLAQRPRGRNGLLDAFPRCGSSFPSAGFQPGQVQACSLEAVPSMLGSQGLCCSSRFYIQSSPSSVCPAARVLPAAGKDRSYVEPSQLGELRWDILVLEVEDKRTVPYGRRYRPDLSPF